MIVSKENCTGCPVFDSHDDKHKDRMILNNICNKRNAVGCDRNG